MLFPPSQDLLILKRWYSHVFPFPLIDYVLLNNPIRLKHPLNFLINFLSVSLAPNGYPTISYRGASSLLVHCLLERNLITLICYQSTNFSLYIPSGIHASCIRSPSSWLLFYTINNKHTYMPFTNYTRVGLVSLGQTLSAATYQLCSLDNPFPVADLLSIGLSAVWAWAVCRLLLCRSFDLLCTRSCQRYRRVSVRASRESILLNFSTPPSCSPHSPTQSCSQYHWSFPSPHYCNSLSWYLGTGYPAFTQPVF